MSAARIMGRLAIREVPSERRSGRRSVVFALSPLLATLAYVVGAQLDSPFFRDFILSERGVIENGTALLLVVAGFASIGVARARALALPSRVFLILFAAGALFVALEEISYGQQFFGWKSPEWFMSHNVNRETNLHNLFNNRPSRRIRIWGGYVFFSVFFIGAPLARRWLRRRGRSPMSLLPGPELAPLVVLALLVNLPNKLPDWMIGPPIRSPDLRELQELYFAWAAAGYALTVRRRSAAISSATVFTQAARVESAGVGRGLDDPSPRSHPAVRSARGARG